MATALNVDKQTLATLIENGKFGWALMELSALSSTPVKYHSTPPAHSHNDCSPVARARAHHPVYRDGRLMQAAA